MPTSNVASEHNWYPDDHQDQGSELEQGKGASALEELTSFRDRLRADLDPVQLPEPAMVLDTASRRGSEVRLFQHLHTMCVLHRENFWMSMRVKHLLLIDAYLGMVSASNPIGIYLTARSGLELNAFLQEVQKRLQRTTLSVDSNHWVSFGEEFFGLLIRARFGTTNPLHHPKLLESGVSPKKLKPFNITECLKGLAVGPGWADTIDRYDQLSDFVHHNLSSSTAANSGSTTALAARSSFGGALVSRNGPMPITQYEYPPEGKAAKAVNETAAGFLRDIKACIEWLNLTPGSPFPVEMVTRMTGSPVGFTRLR